MASEFSYNNCANNLLFISVSLKKILCNQQQHQYKSDI